MEYYSLGKGVTAFTTDRSIGRDRESLLGALGMDDMPYFYPHQTHTDGVMAFDEKVLGELLKENLPQREAACRWGEGRDAVITNLTGVCIGISTADCIPVLVYDPVHHCAAAIHAGWKGTVRHIVDNALKAMHDAYGTMAEDCMAAIGPGISQESFEVGWEVHQQFADAGFEMDEVTTILPARVGDGEKPHIDLKEINRRQLLSKGVKANNIMVSPVDTFTDARFFSARREQVGDKKCGRILSGFVLHP